MSEYMESYYSAWHTVSAVYVLAIISWDFSGFTGRKYALAN